VALGGDLPAIGKEAGVNCLEVEQHLHIFGSTVSSPGRLVMASYRDLARMSSRAAHIHTAVRAAHVHVTVVHLDA
jgi:hypothetical protein